MILKDNKNTENDLTQKEIGKGDPENSLAVQGLRFYLPVQGMWVHSLVGKLIFHMPHGQKNKNIKQKQYCNKFNKDFKNDPHQKKKKIFKKKEKETQTSRKDGEIREKT